MSDNTFFAWVSGIFLLLIGVVAVLFRQFTDPGFWLGVVTVVAVAGLVPMLRSSFGLLGGYLGRVVYAYYYYYQDDFPDYVNFTLNLFYEDDFLKRWFDIDSLIADIPLTSLYLNAYVAFRVRRAFGFTTPGNSLVRFDRPRRSKSWLCHFRHRRYRKVPFSKARAMLEGDMKRRYALVYNPLISKLGQFTTNQEAINHAFGIPHDVEVLVLALTYERGIPYRSQHGRVMVIPQNELLNLPEECAHVRHRNYTTRFETLEELADTYRRNPHRFGQMYVRIPKWMRYLEQQRIAALEQERMAKMA